MGRNDPKKHTPGRGHRKGWNTIKKKRGKKIAQKIQDKKDALKEECEKWLSLTDEQRRLLRGSDAEPKEPCPEPEDV